jgi:hypothetical protein
MRGASAALQLLLASHLEVASICPFCCYDVKCSKEGIFKPGDVFRDRIIHIDAKSKTCHDITNGGIYTMHRWIGPDSDGKAHSREVARAFREGLSGIR